MNTKELKRKKPTYAELESELKASKETVRDYSNRIMELDKIQRDYEQRLDFFHTAVNLMSNGTIGTWDLAYALEKVVAFGFAEYQWEAGEKLAEIYSQFNESDDPRDWNGYVVFMVYDKAMDMIYDAFPSADGCISFDHAGGCYTEFHDCEGHHEDEDDDGRIYLDFTIEVSKMMEDDPEEFKKYKGILVEIFKDLQDEGMLNAIVRKKSVAVEQKTA